MATKIHRNVNATDSDIAAFCARWDVVELDLFGSVLRDDFSAESDVDVMVTFAPGRSPSLATLVAMRDELAALFGRSVDLVERRLVEASENPYRRAHILSNHQRVYVA